jgi:predicted membrane protein
LGGVFHGFRKKTRKLVLSALFIALGLVLPLLTGQIPEIGAMLSPLHIPALLCGFVCGWQWGLAVGFIIPLLRAVTFGMPPLFRRRLRWRLNWRRTAA